MTNKYQQILDAYKDSKINLIKVFCKKHDLCFDYFVNEFVVSISDYIIDIDDIFYDLENDFPAGKIVEYYGENLDIIGEIIKLEGRLEGEKERGERAILLAQLEDLEFKKRLSFRNWLKFDRTDFKDNPE